MKTRIPRIFPVIATCFALALSAHAENSFSSFAGVALDTSPKTGKGLELTLRGVFAGQYAINNTYLIRGDFCVDTDDILEHGLFQDTTARFSINEASFSYRFTGANVMQQISAFVGRQESLGSDLFLKRYFGVRSFSSPFLSPQLYYATPGIYNYSGVGVSYVVKLPLSMAVGVYFSYDKDRDAATTVDTADETAAATETTETAAATGTAAGATTKPKNMYHLDVRYAGVWDTISLDSGIGIVLPIENVDDAGHEVVMIIKKMEIRLGAGLLFETNSAVSLFAQVGIMGMQISPSEGAFKLGLKDVYLFFEPRFTTNVLLCNVSFFSLPESALRNCIYTSSPIGFSVMLESQPFLLVGHGARAGGYLSVASSDLSNIGLSTIDIQITPYLTYSIANGKLNVYSQIHPLLFKDASKFINLSIGYKTIL